MKAKKVNPRQMPASYRVEMFLQRVVLNKIALGIFVGSLIAIGLQQIINAAGQ